ncbi:MAG: bifunctional folylpolyglutamate synthase/dihydrofolate synthase [Clostridia bacterium]|nr:bifunctional folylpolyglutamate synthase/dihydrofolate synthase [Clostridia bacterium]
MTFNNAMKYIQSAARVGGRPTLERMRLICHYLGNPERRLKFVHIAGTNGKGSVAAMLSSVLTGAGYRCGRFVSPYILEFRERICIDGEMIPHAALAEYTAQVAAAVRKMQSDIAAAREGAPVTAPIPAAMLNGDIPDTPVQFELITAIGFLYFKQQYCDIVVLECGLGGRFDATNVIPPPLCTILTGIGLDHTELLGDTVEQIAAEKCGIIKRGCTEVVSGRQPISVMNVITDACAAVNCRLTQLSLAELRIDRATLNGLHITYCGQTYTVSLCAAYQALNAATVLEAVRALRRVGLNLPEAGVRSALASTRFPARFEVISMAPMIVVDGAHNRHGIDALCESMNMLRSRVPGRLHLLVGMLRDKNPGQALAALETIFTGEDPFSLGGIDVVTPDSPRAMPAEELAELLRGMPFFADAEIRVVKAPVADVCRSAVARLSEEDGLLCFGSLYLAAELRQPLHDAIDYR